MLDAAFALRSSTLVYTLIGSLPSWIQELQALEFMYVMSVFCQSIGANRNETESSSNGLCRSHIAGKPGATNLVSLPDDMFSTMSQLTTIHFGEHHLLTALPSFKGLSNLKSMTLAGVQMKKLPSLEPLWNLERLEVLMASSLKHIPSFAPLQKLAYLVIANAPACCNGVLGSCTSTCGTDTCIDSSGGIDEPTQTILDRFNATVCVKRIGDWPSPSSSSSASSNSTGETPEGPSERDVAVCGGVLYRACNTTGFDGLATTGMCYNDRMQAIACSTNSMSINVRKTQILRRSGLPCDVVEEKWLGCGV